MAFRRASGLVGAARKIGASRLARISARYSSGLFDDHVGQQHAVHARIRAAAQNGFIPMRTTGIQIGEDHNPAGGARRAQLARNLQHIG